jgi:hypothetical protein
MSARRVIPPELYYPGGSPAHYPTGERLMKNKKEKKKLTLAKETVRIHAALDLDDLETAAGGNTDPSPIGTPIIQNDGCSN